MPRPPTDDQLDEVAEAAIPLLDALGAKAFELPDDPPRCIVDGKRAPWVAWIDYFPEGEATELTRAVLNLCSDHADTFHHAHRHRRAEYRGRPIVRLSLAQHR